MFGKRSGLGYGVQWDFGELTPGISKQIDQVIAEFTYKDGWTFHWVVEAEKFVIIAKVTLPSNRKGVDTVHFDQRAECNLSQVLVAPVEATLAQLRLAIWCLELHEMNEYCLYRGVRVWDPHRRCEENPRLDG